MSVENIDSCSQKNSAERKGYVRAHRSFNRIWKERDSADPDILGKILEKDNLNRAFKRVKANKGAPGIDGMTVKQALPWLREHNQELKEKIRKGHYTPSPVRRKEIPKPDGGVRKLGIPTVIDRTIELYPEKRDDKHLIKTIHFTFPVTYDGESGALFVRTNELQVETCALLSKLQGKKHIETGISLSKREIGGQP